MQARVRWTSKEWDLVLRRMARNKSLFRSMKERIVDGMTALPPERRRDPTSVGGSSFPWKKDLLSLEREMAEELEHIQGDTNTTPSPAPLDLTKVPDKELYAEVVRRLGLFVLQNSSSALLSLMSPQTTSLIPEPSTPGKGDGAFVVDRDQGSASQASQQNQATASSYSGGGIKQATLPKVVFIGVYGKNAALLKARFDPYMKSSFFDSDSQVTSVQAACAAADIIYICVERVPHRLKDALAPLKGRKEIHYQKGGTSALDRDVSLRFGIPQED